MKKLLCFVMLIMLMVMSAVAEDNADFSLYKGISFGMKYYDALSGRGLHCRIGESELVGMYLDYSDRLFCFVHDQTIAGVEGASMYVHMNSDDCNTAVVSTVQYILGKYPKGVTVDEQQYKRIETMLTEKYGRTDYNNITGKKLPCDAKKINPYRLEPFGYHTYSLTSLYTDSNSNTVSCPKYSQWIVPVSNGYVIVEHSLFEYIEFSNRPGYYEIVNYAYLTQAEYKMKIQDKTTKMYGDL